MAKIHKMQLVLDVEVQPNGESREALKERLQSIADQAAGNGCFTGDGPAECVHWEARVWDNTPKTTKPPRYSKKMLAELKGRNPFALYDKPNRDQATEACKLILDNYVLDGNAKKWGKAIRTLGAQARVGMTDTASREMIEMYLWVALKDQFPSGRQRQEHISHVMQAIMDYC